MKPYQKMLVRHLMRRGIFHNYWVLNDIDEIMHVVDNEITSGIMTDRPKVLKKLLQDYENSKLPDRRISNCTNPKAFMKIQIDVTVVGDGSISCEERADSMIEHLEWKMPNTFEYLIYKDTTKTGNFEVMLYKDGACTGDPIRVHSGKIRCAFPHANWDVFEAFLRAALKGF